MNNAPENQYLEDCKGLTKPTICEKIIFYSWIVITLALIVFLVYLLGRGVR